jgi:hypothetical protein
MNVVAKVLIRRFSRPRPLNHLRKPGPRMTHRSSVKATPFASSGFSVCPLVVDGFLSSCSACKVLPERTVQVDVPEDHPSAAAPHRPTVHAAALSAWPCSADDTLRVQIIQSSCSFERCLPYLHHMIPRIVHFNASCHYQSSVSQVTLPLSRGQRSNDYSSAATKSRVIWFRSIQLRLHTSGICLLGSCFHRVT